MSGVEKSLSSATDLILEALTNNPIQGKPGIKGKLVDPEGFPRYSCTHTHTCTHTYIHTLPLILSLTLTLALVLALALALAVSRPLVFYFFAYAFTHI